MNRQQQTYRESSFYVGWMRGTLVYGSIIPSFRIFIPLPCPKKISLVIAREGVPGPDRVGEGRPGSGYARVRRRQLRPNLSLFGFWSRAARSLCRTAFAKSATMVRTSPSLSFMFSAYSCCSSFERFKRRSKWSHVQIARSSQVCLGFVTRFAHFLVISCTRRSSCSWYPCLRFIAGSVDVVSASIFSI